MLERDCNVYNNSIGNNSIGRTLYSPGDEDLAFLHAQVDFGAGTIHNSALPLFYINKTPMT